MNDWHINSAESDQFEYGHKFGNQLEKSPNPFSATDHDPVMIDLAYPKLKKEPVTTPPEQNDGGALGTIGLSIMGLLALARRRLIVK